MPNLNDAADDIGAVHLLLLGDSKHGKTTYVADAAIAGFQVIYLDSDNGLSALKYRLKDHPEAMERVFLIQTAKPADFLENFFEADKVFKWNLSKDLPVGKIHKTAGERVLEINIEKMAQNPNIILAIDSWTSVSYQAISSAAKKEGLTAADFKSNQQGVYGKANMQLNFILAVLQAFPTHVILQAHLTYYERYSKPKGLVSQAKQSDSKLEETLRVPISCSNPHGAKMGKYFNHIGTLKLGKLNKRMIDFRVEENAVSGGPPNLEEAVAEFGFDKLTQPPANAGRISDDIIKDYVDEKKESAESTSTLSADTSTKPLKLKTSGLKQKVTK